MLTKLSHSFCDEKTIFCKLFLYVLCIPTLRLPFAPSTPIFPKKWLRLQKLQFFMSQFPFSSLEEDNNIYIIIYYYYLQSVSTPKVLVPPPLKTVTSVTVTTVTVFAHFRKWRRNLLIMANSKSQKVGGSKAACPAKCGAQSYHKKKAQDKTSWACYCHDFS